jgi:hypothetical protein
MVTAKQDSAVVYAFKRFFWSKGNIRWVGKNQCAKLYTLETISTIRNKLIPLLNEYQLPYSKKCQFEIFKEAEFLFRKQAHLKFPDVERLLFLWQYINSFHKKPRRRTIAEERDMIIKYFLRKGK